MALYTIASDARLTRVTDEGSRMWKHVAVYVNESFHVEAWTTDGKFCVESTHIVRCDLAPQKGDKRLTTASGARYYVH